MAWLADLLKDFPSLSVARERLALIEQKLADAEAENAKLRAENANLKAQVSAATVQASFIESNGALWKRGSDGKVEPIAYCPDCKRALSPWPPAPADDNLTCTKCDFIAPFPPSKQREIAAKL